jgi:hypothetical protein
LYEGFDFMVAKLVETTISADSIRLRYADGSNLELELMRFQVPLSELKQPHDLKAYTAIGSRPEEHDTSPGSPATDCARMAASRSSLFLSRCRVP